MKIKNFLKEDVPQFAISTAGTTPISWLLVSDKVDECIRDFDISFYYKIYSGFVKLRTTTVINFVEQQVNPFFVCDDSLKSIIMDVMVTSIQNFTIVNNYSEDFNKSMIYPNLYLSGTKENLAMMKMAW